MKYRFVGNIEKDKLRIIQLSDNEWNLIDLKGNLILTKNCYYIFSLAADGLKRIKISENELNLIDKFGNILLKNNASYISGYFKMGYRIVDGKNWDYKIYLKQKLIKEIINGI